jgi:hypothetical protein
MTEIHMESRTLHDMVIDPDHADRTTSAEFEASVSRLKEDEHYKCWVCGGSDNLQVHHRAVEYMYANIANYDLAKEFLEEWDVYGYGKLLKNRPMLSKDDIRNQMVLCQEHHTGVDQENNKTGTGIHDLTFSSWVIQKLALAGANPVPQKGETWQQALSRVKANERKEA